MYFRSATNLICTISYVQIMYAFISIYLQQILPYPYVPIPSTFVYDPICVPCCVYEASEGIVTLYLCQFFYLSASHCTVRPLTFTVKSDSDKINLMLSAISIITILVKVLQVIWGSATSFVVCQSVCLFVCIFERYAFHIFMS